MGRIFFFSLLSLMLALSACKKNPDSPSHCSNSIQDGNETGVDCGGDCPSCAGGSNSYYFKFNFGGTAYNYTISYPQYGTTDNYTFGGYVPGDASFNTFAGVIIYFNDSATTAHINSIVHDSLFFDGSHPAPSIHHDLNFTSNHLSLSTPDHSYYVYISDINFLRRDTAIFDFDIYSVHGTFKAKMQDDNSNYIGDATNGQFYLQCSAPHLN